MFSVGSGAFCFCIPNQILKLLMSVYLPVSLSFLVFKMEIMMAILQVHYEYWGDHRLSFGFTTSHPHLPFPVLSQKGSYFQRMVLSKWERWPLSSRALQASENCFLPFEDPLFLALRSRLRAHLFSWDEDADFTSIETEAPPSWFSAWSLGVPDKFGGNQWESSQVDVVYSFLSTKQKIKIKEKNRTCFWGTLTLSIRCP